MPDSVQDDIRAAIEANSTPPATPSATPPATPPAKEPVDDFAPPASETLPPVYPTDREEKPKPTEPKTPERGPDGKFLPRDGTAPTPVPIPSVQPPAQPPDDGAVHFDPAKPPAAWTQPMKDKWAAIPEDIRTEITRREEATAQGVQKLMKQFEPAQEIFNAVAPFEDYFEHIQEDPRAYLHSMVQTEQTLRLGNPAQKIELLLALADTYGVPIRTALDQAMDGKLNDLLQQAHEHHKTPPVIPPEIQRELYEQRQWRASVEDQAAQGELEEFAAQPGHEFLDQVRDDMANLIESGVVDTYKDAYDLACFRNPTLRAAVNAQQNGAAQITGMAARQAAAAAVVAPTQAPLVEGGDQPKEDEDTYATVSRAFRSAASDRA